MKRITVTLDEELYKKVKEIADRERRSMSGQVAYLLSTHTSIIFTYDPNTWGHFNAAGNFVSNE